VRSSSTRRAALVALAALVVAAAGIGTALASARHSSGPFSHSHHRALSAKKLLAGTKHLRSRVIVVLRNQLGSLPATRDHAAARIAAEGSADAAIESDVQRSGGRIYRRYHALNAFAASVSSNERTTLAHSAQVAEVVPDTLVTLPQQDTGVANDSHTGALPSNPEQVCPSDPSKPLLEPEALQTTHTAYMNSATPQAQNIVTGTGVKVAFFADGLDVNDPDFVRPNGQHVIVDFKDFSGEGFDAASSSLEAFGDASSIAAQGRQVYDLSQFVNPAHPLPAGCNITVRGVAPGASLVAMKVFGDADSAYNSVILQGLDWALTVDHANVLSESFGGYPIPDSTQDLTRDFNEQAVADGATVVESTGDSGTEASPSSASSDPAVIAAGASTTFQNYAQGTQYGYQLGAGGWESDNISSIESAGITQGGRALDLVAPGEANWALCDDNTAIYQGCTDYAGDPTDIQSFGGTSESAPFIAGGAALVIEAYRNTHHGQTPSPALVKQLLTSTASDLNAPSDEEGSGELNTLGAVQAAESYGNTHNAVGNNLLVGSTQLDLEGQAGSQFSHAVQVTNLGSSSQSVSAHVRELTKQLSNTTGSVTLQDGTSPTFVDQFGDTVPYEQITFHVPKGADRLVTYLAWTGGVSRIGLTLFDPSGQMAAYTRPQGNGNHGEVDVASPAAGTWTGLIFRRDGTFDGPVQWQASTQQFGNADGVSPLSLHLSPGQTGTFHVSGSYPSSAGDSSQDLVVSSSQGTTSIVPIALRSLIAIGNNGGTFSGQIIGGNGRNGFFQPGQIDTYDFYVPRGEPELTASVTLPGSPGSEVFASLISPQDVTVTDGDNVYTNASGQGVDTSGLEAYTPNPQPGEWRFVIDVINPVGGAALSAPYHGRIGFASPPIHVNGLPNGSGNVLPAGHPATVTVHLTNSGLGTMNAFLDPRTDQRQNLSVLPIVQATGLPLPIPGSDEPPLFLMPTETNAVGAFAQATEPVDFDFGFGDPDIPSTRSGDTASASYQGLATPGIWDLTPEPVGPFPDGGATPGTVSAGLVARTLGFDDQDTTESTGDLEDQTVNPNAAPYSPLTLSPGQSGAMTLTITPAGKRGKVVKGTLFVNVYDNQAGIAGELEAIPYSYRIG
jgi:hypothetical protein